MAVYQQKEFIFFIEEYKKIYSTHKQVYILKEVNNYYCKDIEEVKTLILKDNINTFSDKQLNKSISNSISRASKIAFYSKFNKLLKSEYIIYKYEVNEV